MTRGQVAAIASTFFWAGCGPQISVAPVSGSVSLDGQPLANAHVLFQPVATAGKTSVGTGSYALTDGSGNYSLRQADTDQPGAVVGQHRVEINYKTIETDDRDPKTRPPPKSLPPRYNRESQLQFQVERGGSKSANFELKSR